MKNAALEARAISEIALDTHALLWWVLHDRRLSGHIRDLLSGSGTTIVVSSVSGWEIATKHRLGKLAAPLVLAQSLAEVATQNRWQTLALTMEHGQLAGRLPGAHKDPFDRMLAAQAIVEDMPLATDDTAFRGFRSSDGLVKGAS